MRSIFGVLERIAPTDAAVLLEGETGTGKDVVARSIHQQSPRADQPFVVVDCGAVSYNLIESELFGHERGAFTGAVATRQGAFETAGHGTVFLDEVGELPLDVQPKLLARARVRRIPPRGRQPHAQGRGAHRRRDEAQPQRRGRARQVPRGPVLPVGGGAHHGAATAGSPGRHPGARRSTSSRSPRSATPAASITLTPETIAALSAHDWPGNVRELRNVLDRAIYIATASGEREVRLLDLPVSASTGRATSRPVVFALAELPRDPHGLRDRLRAALRLLAARTPRRQHQRRRARGEHGPQAPVRSSAQARSALSGR